MQFSNTWDKAITFVVIYKSKIGFVHTQTHMGLKLPELKATVAYQLVNGVNGIKRMIVLIDFKQSNKNLPML